MVAVCRKSGDYVGVSAGGQAGGLLDVVVYFWTGAIIWNICLQIGRPILHENHKYGSVFWIKYSYPASDKATPASETHAQKPTKLLVFWAFELVSSTLSWFSPTDLETTRKMCSMKICWDISIAT